VVVRLDELDEPVVVRELFSPLTLTFAPPERLCTTLRELLSPLIATPGCRFFLRIRDWLSGSDATKRRFFDTNFLFPNFFLMTVRLDGSSLLKAVVLRERLLWIETLSAWPRTPKRVSERPRMLVRLPLCSLRSDVLLLPDDWPLVSLPRIEELLDPLFSPAFWPLPLFWPAFWPL